MIAINNLKPRFSLGQIVSTPGALEALECNQQTPENFLPRHLALDQGDLSDEDHQSNEAAIEDGERIFSSYLLRDGKTKIWIITEADRSSTCILLPDEY